MSLDKVTRWSGLAAFAAPLLLLSFGSYTFWRYFDEIRQAFGIADGTYIHPLIAVIGLIATALALTGLYQHLPPHTRPTSTWLLRIALAGIFLGLLGVLGFFWPTQEWLFVGVGIGVLLPLVALIGLGYYAFVDKVLGVLSFTPLASAISTLGIFITADYAGGSDRPATQIFVALYVLCWVLLGLGLLKTAEAETGQPVTA